MRIKCHTEKYKYKLCVRTHEVVKIEKIIDVGSLEWEKNFEVRFDVRVCAGCDKKFIPMFSKRLCRKCWEEVQATWNK